MQHGYMADKVNITIKIAPCLPFGPIARLSHPAPFLNAAETCQCAFVKVDVWRHLVASSGCITKGEAHASWVQGTE